MSNLIAFTIEGKVESLNVPNWPTLNPESGEVTNAEGTIMCDSFLSIVTRKGETLEQARLRLDRELEQLPGTHLLPVSANFIFANSVVPPMAPFEEGVIRCGRYGTTITKQMWTPDMTLETHQQVQTEVAVVAATLDSEYSKLTYEERDRLATATRRHDGGEPFWNSAGAARYTGQERVADIHWDEKNKLGVRNEAKEIAACLIAHQLSATGEPFLPERADELVNSLQKLSDEDTADLIIDMITDEESPELTNFGRTYFMLTSKLAKYLFAYQQDPNKIIGTSPEEDSYIKAFCSRAAQKGLIMTESEMKLNILHSRYEVYTYMLSALGATVFTLPLVPEDLDKIPERHAEIAGRYFANDLDIAIRENKLGELGISPDTDAWIFASVMMNDYIRTILKPINDDMEAGVPSARRMFGRNGNSLTYDLMLRQYKILSTYADGDKPEVKTSLTQLKRFLDLAAQY